MTTRAHIEFMLGWLDAIRRRDAPEAQAALDPAVRWHGIRPDLLCEGREAVVEIFLRARDEGFEILSLELVGSEDGVVLGVRRPDLRDIAGTPAEGEIYNHFTIEDGRITCIQDYVRRDDALAAAGVPRT